MWEAIKATLTSANGVALTIIVAILIIAVLLIGIRLGKHGFLTIRTKHFTIGSKVSEREIIRREAETAYNFIMSIEGKIVNDTENYNKWFIKCILEKIYDKAIEWIMFNHITLNQLYVQDKQDTVLNLIYSLPIKDDFKTPEFKQRVENWVKELIEKLVNVKVLYGETSI